MSYVYVVAHRDASGGLTAPVKVGHSQYPAARLSSLQTGNPYRVELVHVFHLPSKEMAILAENECHAVLNFYTMKGEWFECDPLWAVRILGDVVEWAIRDEFGEDEEVYALHVKRSGVAASRQLLGDNE